MGRQLPKLSRDGEVIYVFYCILPWKNIIEQDIVSIIGHHWTKEKEREKNYSFLHSKINLIYTLYNFESYTFSFRVPFSITNQTIKMSIGKSISELEYCYKGISSRVWVEKQKIQRALFTTNKSTCWCHRRSRHQQDRISRHTTMFQHVFQTLAIESPLANYMVDNDNDMTTVQQLVTIPSHHMPPSGTLARAYSINVMVYTVAHLFPFPSLAAREIEPSKQIPLVATRFAALVRSNFISGLSA